jgi:predicted DNA-binding protein (MmcQ/YjbR family)
MNHDTIRDHCLAMPFVTEIVRWGDNLLFKVGGKMFAILALDGTHCSVKCSHETYAELVEQPDVVPTSHNMWRQQWVTLETMDALPDREFRALLTNAYEIVRAGLPAKIRAELDAGRSAEIKPWQPKRKPGRPARTRGQANRE